MHSRGEVILMSKEAEGIVIEISRLISIHEAALRGSAGQNDIEIQRKRLEHSIDFLVQEASKNKPHEVKKLDK